MTGNKLYELSDETLNVLGELDMPVDIKVFSAEEGFHAARGRGPAPL